MTGMEKSIIAKFEARGEKFELLVDAEAAYQYKSGKKTDTANILVAEEVFKDVKKGERHSSEAVKKAFGTNDIYKVLETVLKNGEVQLTTEYKKKMQEEKQKKIVATLARECIDPRTGAPHPPQRIEKAMEEAKVRIDAFKDAEAQMGEVIDALKLILPMKFEKVRIAVRIPAEFAQRAYGSVKGFNIQKEEWANDGSLIVLVEIPAGMQGEFYDRVNKITSGMAETKLLK